jgi:hypothetical protein
MFGSMTTRPHRKLDALRRILRAIAKLDDDDIEKLAKWFSTWVKKRLGTVSGRNGDDD